MSNLWRMFDFSMKLENLYFIKLTVQKTLLFSNFIFFLKVLKRIYNIYVEIFNSIAWICATMPVAWWWAINWLMPTAAPQIVHASQEELALARKVLQWMKRLVKNSKKTCQKKETISPRSPHEWGTSPRCSPNGSPRAGWSWRKPSPQKDSNQNHLQNPKPKNAPNTPRQTILWIYF